MKKPALLSLIAFLPSVRFNGVLQESARRLPWSRALSCKHGANPSGLLSHNEVLTFGFRGGTNFDC